MYFKFCVLKIKLFEIVKKKLFIKILIIRAVADDLRALLEKRCFAVYTATQDWIIWIKKTKKISLI